MGGLISAIFDKPKSIKAPAVKPAIEPPSPTADTTEAGEQARKARPKGREETFIVGDLAPSETFLTGKKRKLA